MDLLPFLAFVSIYNPTCYFYMGSNLYYCDIQDFYNPTGYDGFFLIDGQHSINKNNSNVQVVTFKSLRTQNVPHVICDKFRNLQTFIASSVGIEIVAEVNLNFLTQKCKNHVNFFLDSFSQLHQPQNY